MEKRCKFQFAFPTFFTTLQPLTNSKPKPKFVKTFKILVASYLLLIFQIQAQITVKTIHPDTNPLVDSLIKTLAGYGVSISNVSSNLKPTTKSVGTFMASLADFPLSRGLVMSNGNIDSIPKSNKSKTLSTRMNYADTLAGNSLGKQLLQTILNRQSSTEVPQRATEISTIKFDLLPIGDTLSFKYIFGSEEYPEFVCSQFNDIFGFFIKGPGIQGDSIYNETSMEGFSNMARIPGKDLPVAINTVNSGISGANARTENCQFSPEGTAQFTPNDKKENPLYSSLQFDGLTKVLTAKSAVIPCQVYTLVLAISDVGDRLFDSGIFLERGSMISSAYSAQVSSQSNGLKDTITSCHPGKLLFKRCPNIDEKWTIRFRFEGSAIPNQDFKRRMPDGQLSNVPDSVVLAPGQISDSLLLEGIGSGMDIKNLIIKYLDLKNPFIGTQPNYSGNETNFQVRPFANKPISLISGCWFDSAQIAFQRPGLAQIQYRWLGLEEEGQELGLINCDTCQSPKIVIDTINRSYAVEMENMVNSCTTRDTVSVSGIPFYLPQFSIVNDTIEIKNAQANYQYQWVVNGILALSNSYQIAYNENDQISLDVSTPKGCHITIYQNSILTEIKHAEGFNNLISIAPNPSNDYIQIKHPLISVFAYKIFSLTGKLKSQSRAFTSSNINIKGLESGLYHIVISDNSGHHFVSRFIKED